MVILGACICWCGMLYSTSVEDATVFQHGRFYFHRNVLNMIAEEEWVSCNCRWCLFALLGAIAVIVALIFVCPDAACHKWWILISDLKLSNCNALHHTNLFRWEWRFYPKAYWCLTIKSTTFLHLFLRLRTCGALSTFPCTLLRLCSCHRDSFIFIVQILISMSIFGVCVELIQGASRETGVFELDVMEQVEGVEASVGGS